MAWHLFTSPLKTIINFLYPESNPPALEITNLEDVTTVDDGASSSIAPGSTYEVFLSFRGPDIRRSFTDHLYGSLTGAGIRTFRDNEDLRVGEEIGPDLMKAIEESSIFIPIFSKGYASSKWCLREVTHMVTCMNDIDPEGHRRHTVCPIFYDVTPEDVKRQTGSFAEAFLKHTNDKEVYESTVQEWKDALKKVGKLKGWEKDKIADGHEAKLVRKIVTEVCEKLKKGHVSQPDDLVGMDHHIEAMTKLLDNGGNGVRIVGIVGLGGIGKTTIAKFMYNKLCDQFQPQCSFVDDVRERVKRNGYAELQEHLISDVLKRREGRIKINKDTFRDKKVLIVLDDVEDRFQLKEIIGGSDSPLATNEYFGSGSRIIVTTRNRKVFEEWDGDLIYAPKEMKFEDSLLLFCKHAFRSTQPGEGYEKISGEVVQTAAGLPLSLVVIGSMLFSEKKEYWEATLKKLKKIPAKDVQKKLKISYDALDGGQKQIFLDIACHFIGEDKTLPCYMWEDCGFFPGCEIANLVYFSLITLEGNVFRMHDQLRDLGRYIVNRNNPDASEERGSRLWSHEEAIDTLKNQSGKEKVQTLHIDYLDQSSFYHSDHDFKGMSKLRYLHLEGYLNLEGNFKGLLPDLLWFKCFQWEFGVTNFCPRKLVILDLSHSNIWDGWENSIQIKQLTNLKVLNLSYCHGLTKTPDFFTLSNLERLKLEGCQYLTEIGSSVNHLKRLTYFNAKFCRRLRKLPPVFGSMTSLQELHLDSNTGGIDEVPKSIGLLTKLRCLSLRGCTSAVKIPESIWNLKSLVELNLSGTRITEISESVGILEKLEVLNCFRCESLRGVVPNGIEKLTSLRVLNLDRTKVHTLPDSVGSLCNLRKLNLSGTDIKKLPGVGIESLLKLEELDCSMCSSLEGPLPEGIWRLSSLRVLNFENTEIIGCLPKDISGMSRLLNLDFGHCGKLQLCVEGLKLSPTLTKLVIPLAKASLDSITSLVNLRDLKFYKNVKYCCEPMEEVMAGVVDHDNNNNGTPLLSIIDMPSNLEYLTLVELDEHVLSCRLLPAIKFDSSSRLKHLKISSCTLPTGSLNLSNCQMLNELRIEKCHGMKEIANFGSLFGGIWKHIYISNCDSLEVLLVPDLSSLKRFTSLHIWRCLKLREIKGLEVLTSLMKLDLLQCPLLMWPDLDNYERLEVDKIVGMDHHIEEMTKLLDNDGNHMRIVGIVGMGGIGKTTIAKFMYNRLYDQFQHQCSFLEDVRERVIKRNGYAELRKQLISNVLKRSVDETTLDIRNAFRYKKVLIVLDDVEERSQLAEIIGGLEYFGSGSRIIVTTRNIEVFEEWDGDLIYEPSVMDSDDSLFLFCKYAFKSTQPQEGFEAISKEIVQVAAGLPLSLVVIGSMLFWMKRKEYWEATLQKLKKIPAKDIQKRWKISYDALTYYQQKMFLDIACHFIGQDITYAIHMWEDCWLNPESYNGIDVLVSLSLITIENFRNSDGDYMKIFMMHDQFRDLGRDIVYQESPSDHPGQRSRLWSNEEAREVLDNQSDDNVLWMHDHLKNFLREIVKYENYSHSGKRSRLWSWDEGREVLHCQSGTERVETLSMNYRWDSDCIISNEHFKGLSSLRYLRLEGSRLKGDFKGLVSDLRWFRWRYFKDSTDALHNFGLGKSGMPMTNFCPHKLVVLDLSYSDIMDGWESWIQIKAATNLKVLNLSSCRYLTKLPECLWNMKSLVELDLSHTEIAELPEQGIGNLTNLIKLILSNSKIKRLPDAIGKLKKLQVLDCFNCRELAGEVPSGIESLSSLRVLNLDNKSEQE